MSVLQERLMLVLGETGRVAVTTKAVLRRLQERWPTQHGYGAPFIQQTLNELQASGSIHCSVSGRWTRSMKVKSEQTPAAPAPTPAKSAAESFADQIKVANTAHQISQENDVADKTKTCTGPCGKEKPIGEFYAKCNQCKRCVLDRQRELKAAKGKSTKAALVAKSPAIKVPKAKAAAKPSAIKNLKAKAAAKKLELAAPRVNGSMVAISFALHIEDMHGVFHDVSVTKAVVERLVTELRAYA